MFSFISKEQKMALYVSGDDLVFTINQVAQVQAQWGWANSDANGKWGNPFQAYKILRNYTPSGAGML